MKNLILISFALCVFLASCTSWTTIQSTPPGADVYVAEQKVGVTPYKYNDTKIVGSVTHIKLKKEGYDTKEVDLKRNEKVDVGAVIGTLIAVLPVLWIMQYDKDHNYELTPIKK